MVALELAQEQRKEVAAGAGRGADCECSVKLAALLPRELLVELMLELEDALSLLVQDEPGLGRLNAAPGAVEERATEPLLQRADLEADRRLRYAQALGGLREALLLDDRHERRQLTGVHKHSLWTA
jgi:hypothetical protein